MAYRSHPSEMHDASRREPQQQQLSRASSSYEYRHPEMGRYDSHALQPWSSEASFSPPKLPPPRNVPSDARYTYHESGPSVRDGRYDEYGRQRSLHTEYGHHGLADTTSRSHPLQLRDQPMIQYAQSTSAGPRPMDASPSRMRGDAHQAADQSRLIDLQTRPFADNRPRADSVARMPMLNGRAMSSRSEQYPEPHDLPRHHLQVPQQDRRMSMQPAAIDPSHSSRYSADSTTPAWPVPRPSQHGGHGGKRPLPSDHEIDLGHPASASAQRQYALPAAQVRRDSSIASRAPPSVFDTPSVPAQMHDRNMQSYEGATKPSVSLTPHPSENVVSARHASAVPASPNVAAQPISATAAPPQPSLHPQRKRLRISRACDECRRRKTRCDIVGAYPGEPGHPLTISGAVPPLEPNTEPTGEMLILQPCMNCRRSDVTCSYSKRPLKRGPSKGYIKDLERRLNSLESQIVTEGQDQDQHRPSIDAGSGAPQQNNKPKIRTEDRISRLESVLARPCTAKSEKSDEGKIGSYESSRSSSEAVGARVKSEASADSELNLIASTAEAPVQEQAENEPARPASISPGTPPLPTAHHAPMTESISADSRPASTSSLQRRKLKGKGKGKAKRRSAGPAISAAQDANVAEVKAQIVSSFLHGSFPIIPVRSEAGASTNNISRLEDRVLVRGLRLLMDPVEMVAPPSDTPSHASRLASLIGQASSGLSPPRDSLPTTPSLTSQLKLSRQLSSHEADLLLLCHLDHLRNGRNNNSALAAAVSKLSSNDASSYHRRTVLLMLDRWHAVGFSTPHLLTGRFGMERESFKSMKECLGSLEGNMLGEGVWEVLRGAIMFGLLNDLVQDRGGWKGVGRSDVEAVIHSATDENERNTAAEPESSSSGEAPGLLSTEALRYNLESSLRTYHAINTLPATKDASIDDLHRLFSLAESILVLGMAKTPISLQGKLIQSAIGPHVLAIAGVAFSWCLRVICALVTQEEATVLPLEFYRRKILDYVRMCGPFCLFSGGAPTAPASFAPVYLRLALYFNQTVGFAAGIGSLVSPRPDEQKVDGAVMAEDADTLLDMAKEMGCLGYVLAGTSQREALRLLTAS